MKVLVLGGSGMLGTDVVSLLRSQRHEVWAPDLHELDLSQPPVEGFADGFDWVVNCAAYTAVDQAESDRDAATVLNEAAPFLVASALGLGTQMIHISTDYVFDGTKQGAYLETDPVCPIGVYGKSKAAGEAALLSAREDSYVLRTAWLYGPHGKCFPKAIINRWQGGGALRVVADQRGCPTYTGELARAILSIMETRPEPGIYHACGPQAMTWHDFAVQTLHVFENLHPTNLEINIEPIRSEDWPTPAARPANSVLDCSKLKTATGFEPESVGVSLIRFIEEAY